MNSATSPNVLLAPNVRHTNLIARRPIASVLVIMFALTWLGLIPDALASQGLIPFHLPLLLQLPIGWAPAIATLIVVASMNGRQGIRKVLGRFLIVRVGIQWYVLALFGLAAVLLGGIGLYVLFGGAMPVIPLTGAPVSAILISFVLSMALGVLFNTEEVAWRGFILPRLQARHTALIASLLIAVPEALYHLPYFFNKDVAFYQNIGIVTFTLFTAIETILFTWIFNNTRGSLVIVTLLHASQNTWANLLSDNQLGPFYGNVILLAILMLIVLVVFGSRHLSRKPVAPATGFSDATG